MWMISSGGRERRSRVLGVIVIVVVSSPFVLAFVVDVCEWWRCGGVDEGDVATSGGGG